MCFSLFVVFVWLRSLLFYIGCLEFVLRFYLFCYSCVLAQTCMIVACALCVHFRLCIEVS